MEFGARGRRGRSAQPHAVQGHRVELVHVTIHSPRMEATSVMVKQVTLSHVPGSHVRVSARSFNYTFLLLLCKYEHVCLGDVYLVSGETRQIYDTQNL